MTRINARRGLLTGLVCMAALMSATMGRAAVDMDGVLALWLFDDGDGEELTDATENAYDGALVNNPQWVDGKFEGGLRFDGNTNYVEVVDPIIPETVDFTYGAWLNPGEQTQQWACAYGNFREPPRRSIGWAQESLINNFMFCIVGNGAEWLGFDTGLRTQLEMDTWQHLVAVREGSTLTYYLDGDVVDEGDVGPGPMLAADQPFHIGNWATTNDRWWNGVIDDIFIFARALTAAEVRSIRDNGIAGAVLPVSPKSNASVVWARLKARDMDVH